MALFKNNKQDPSIETRIEQAEKNADFWMQEYTDLKERITELELSIEDTEWTKLAGEEARNFSRGALDSINRMARVYWMKSPLIKRAVATQVNYVFSKGMEVYAENEQIDEVIQDFLNDPKNKNEIEDQQGREQKEMDLQLFGNIFFMLFVNPSTGRVRIRTVPVDEIREIITDPNDAKTKLGYKRQWNAYIWDNEKTEYKWETRTEYIADWKNISLRNLPQETEDNKFIYHVATNKLSDQKFGLSEVYAALDWAKAYKEFLEDWATLARSYATFAWKLRTKGGRGVQNAYDTFQNQYPESTGENRNPAPNAGSYFISSNEDLQPFKLSGANMDASDGDKMIHMVCAATGVFYHYLIGDPSTGNLATAKTMELPMLLMFMARQNLWMRTYKEICWFVVEQSVRAVNGKLNGLGDIEQNDWGEEQVVFDVDEQGNDIEADIKVKFPPILEKDMNERIKSIIHGATLGGGQATAKALTMKDITRYLLQAIGEENIEDKINEMYPEDGNGMQQAEQVVDLLNKNLERIFENRKDE